MSYQDSKQLMKTRASNSLNEANLKQILHGQTNESGDEDEMQNTQTAISTTEVKRTKTVQPSNSQDLSMTMDNIKVDSDKITFVTEKDFKFEKNCWVCKILFGKINERQHHCRLCAHSVCKVCSGKRVNDNRVCDICFLKMKNVKGEKRKKKLLAAMKNFIKNLSININKGGEEYKKLESKNKALKEQARQEEESRQNELDLLKAKLTQLQSSKAKFENKIKDQEITLSKKKIERQQELDLLHDLEIKVKNIDGDIELQKEAKQSRDNQLLQLNRQKMQLQNQESFLRLPNYERAKRNDPDNVCEAIIFLDNNDQRNGINHYNTVSNNNVFQSTTDSTSGDKQNQPNTTKQQTQARTENNKSEYANSYNQGLIEESEIIQHNSRSGKKKNRGAGKGTSCLCD